MPGRRGGGGSRRGSRQPQKSKAKTPKLVRWTNDLDIELLLAVQCWCQKLGMKIPWDRICKEYFGEPFTEGAIVQHLAKLRARRIEAGLRVPPPLRRSPREAEKQAAALKRKEQERKDAESDEEAHADGLFIEENDDDEEYLPAPKRAKKDPKSKKRATLETGNTVTIHPPSSMRPIRLHPFDDPAAHFDAEYTYHPSSAPSPFDTRYRDTRPTTTHLTEGQWAHDASTSQSPANAGQPQSIPPTGLASFSGQINSCTTSTYPPVSGPAYGEPGLGMSPHVLTFNQANQANPTYAMPPPAFPPYSMGPPASAFSAGHPMTDSASHMATSQNFGRASYGSQQQDWMQSPAENHGAEANNPLGHQSDAQSEVKQEGEATFDPEGTLEFDFDEFLSDE